jgi:hypothetical protein
LRDRAHNIHSERSFDEKHVHPCLSEVMEHFTDPLFDVLVDGIGKLGGVLGGCGVLDAVQPGGMRNTYSAGTRREERKYHGHHVDLEHSTAQFVPLILEDLAEVLVPVRVKERE